MREKKPFGCGRERMVARVIRTEDSDEACEFAKKHIRKGSAIHADEHFSYDDPAGLSELNRVDQCKGIRD
ncbi:transposase [Rhizobium sullae]|uniref:ISXO2 transposase-like protein n=1 Tax=Rhizobium sullae TaxID=50338 RepID=A0A4R3PU43_RHISU|nr:transposase [Rhizobium sullae]TCU07826.1 ISXO2 transposase-like protein [Rhizobium sullae]